MLSVFLMWSTRRPGVDTRMLMPLRSLRGDGDKIVSALFRNNLSGLQGEPAELPSRGFGKEIPSQGRGLGGEEDDGEHLAFSAFLFSPPIRTPGTIQVNGCRSTNSS